jgi:hypothetical protein
MDCARTDLGLKRPIGERDTAIDNGKHKAEARNCNQMQDMANGQTTHGDPPEGKSIACKFTGRAAALPV